MSSGWHNRRPEQEETHEGDPEAGVDRWNARGCGDCGRGHWLRAGVRIAVRSDGYAVTRAAPDSLSAVAGCGQHLDGGRGHAIAARQAPEANAGSDRGAAGCDTAADWLAEVNNSGRPAADAGPDPAKACTDADADGSPAGSVPAADADRPAADAGSVADAESDAVMRRPGQPTMIR
jgi:hypothetical protein